MIEAHAFVFFLIPTLAGVASALFGLAWKPSAQVRSGVQHFAAGIVFAAVASEIIPEILERNFVVAFAIGFPLGVALVVALRQLDRFMQRRRAASGSKQAAGAMGIVAPVAVDLSIDGLLVGVGFISGTGMGRLLAIALTMEMMFLGLSVAQMLTKHGYARRQAAGMTVVASCPVFQLSSHLMINNNSGVKYEKVIHFCCDRICIWFGGGFFAGKLFVAEV